MWNKNKTLRYVGSVSLFHMDFYFNHFEKQKYLGNVESFLNRIKYTNHSDY